jgi:hypothetical protein
MKKIYAPPKVLATYTKEQLAAAIRPHGPTGSYGGGQNGCGCGCGCGG